MDTRAAPARLDAPTGSLATALAHGERLLSIAPVMAARQAAEILAVVPGEQHARALLARALDRAPNDPALWRTLGDHCHLAGDPGEADRAYLAGVRVSVSDAGLREAAAALTAGRLAIAEPLLRAHLKAHPTDIAAMRMLAELAARLGRYTDAEALLARAIELCPSFDAARHNLALVLYRQNRGADALAHLEILLAQAPGDPGYRNLRAAALSQIGEYAAAITLWEEALTAHPDQAKIWMSYGHGLKTVGRATDSVAAYRRALALEPGLGEAWWSLANMKTYRFTDAEIAKMRTQLERNLDPEDRLHFEFALGKAAEDRADPETAFAHYARGNAIGAERSGYDPHEIASLAQQSAALFTPAFFAARTGGGDPAPDSIFIVGLPRAGSTLVEQILASHPQVEGTMELPELVAIARRLGGPRRRGAPSPYPNLLADLTPEQRLELGREYLERTRVYRKTDKPFFIDKLPNNWAHAGLIHLILPNAKIIDARRHPMANGFSAWKQHFARGQGFTYDLDWLGRYYRNYVATMAALDRALPGRVHRVIYERMVSNTETEVRALLAHCGLPFDPAALAFHESKRPVRTPSAEQVRQPIYAKAVDEWQQFATMLQPLRHALGDVLDAYPQVPDGL